MKVIGLLLILSINICCSNAQYVNITTIKQRISELDLDPNIFISMICEIQSYYAGGGRGNINNINFVGEPDKEIPIIRPPCNVFNYICKKSYDALLDVKNHIAKSSWVRTTSGCNCCSPIGIPKILLELSKIVMENAVDDITYAYTECPKPKDMLIDTKCAAASTWYP